ncbi:MAG: hypothetical protein OH338_00465 [Candidatus Parvarchaeota archaeon]|nr:hypothetical protein [Candidatus Parvarchaeota archaeon]MCW1294608.1 hypothetical protein [Candidatus Parvarchaeum tengchongense]MCW1296011.1 hypothetical protein [Candidatus Parvarchaeum tengchongense]MCW1298915.1 hypothetical protein [Candidatus Parvarchaeum tengchongense]MCW1311889.1 hypothetical protein [Candidatus Parvarchaeum tengchongense]
MEKKENDAIYSAITGIAKVIKDNMNEQKERPRKVSINLDKLEINMSGLKYPVKLSAKIDLDFSGKSKEEKQQKQ